MNGLLQGFRALGPQRLLALGGVGLGMVALLLFLALRGSSEQMALLYADLDLRDSAQVTEQLGRRHIPYRLGANGTQIMVPADQVPEARVMLAREGIPAGGSIGYEIFDRSDGFAASDFQQQIAETRALEGELARTIRAIRGVRAARVHLVLPRREPFARAQQEAQASVLLTMAGAMRLDREGVQSILNLVAAAVPGLRPQNIAVVDSRGDLLARAGEPVGPSGAAQSHEEMERGTELRLARAVEEMLERTLGPGHVRAEASVRFNYERINETQERYDPDGQVTRSTQSVTSNSKSTEASQAVSVQNNLPNGDAGSSGTGSQESRQEETTNYEISRTVRTLIREQPQIDRISLAVMVDGAETTAADGSKTWQPRAEEELARITTLVKSAIGFDAKRGDSVEVVSMRFAAPAAEAAPAPGMFALEKADVLRLAQTALFGIIGLAGLMFILRPMLRSLAAVPAKAVAHAATPGLPDRAGSAAPALPGAHGESRATEAPMLEDETLVAVANVEGQMRASSIRRVVETVERHPDETLTIMRGWMLQEGG